MFISYVFKKYGLMPLIMYTILSYIIFDFQGDPRGMDFFNQFRIYMGLLLFPVCEIAINRILPPADLPGGWYTWEGIAIIKLLYVFWKVIKLYMVFSFAFIIGPIVILFNWLEYKTID